MAKKRSFSDIFSKYKTYDDSEGRGNPDQWRSAFNERMGYKQAVDHLKDVKEETIPFAAEMKTAKTEDALKKIYRAAMNLHHPDKGGQHKTAQDIIALYTVLFEKLEGKRA